MLHNDLRKAVREMDNVPSTHTQHPPTVQRQLPAARFAPSYRANNSTAAADETP
jgi:hypothetical protein